MAALERRLAARERQLEVDFDYVLSELDVRLASKKEDIREAQLAMNQLQAKLDEREREMQGRESTVRSLLAVGASGAGDVVVGAPNNLEGGVSHGGGASLLASDTPLPPLPACAVESSASAVHANANDMSAASANAPAMAQVLSLLDRVSSQLLHTASQLGPDGEPNDGPRRSSRSSDIGGEADGAQATVDLQLVKHDQAGTFTDQLQTLASYLRLVHTGFVSSAAPSLAPSPKRITLPSEAVAGSVAPAATWPPPSQASPPTPTPPPPPPLTAAPLPPPPIVAAPTPPPPPPPIVAAPTPPPPPPPPPPIVPTPPPPVQAPAIPPPAAPKDAPVPESKPQPCERSDSASTASTASTPKSARPMRAVHWSKLPNAKLGESVWAIIDVDGFAVDLALTEELFAVPQPKAQVKPMGVRGRAAAFGGAVDASASAGGASKSGVGASKPVGGAATMSDKPTLHVISVQRANNVGIFLKRTSKLLTCDQLCKAVVRLEEAVLEPELLDSILSNLPPETEAKALRALKGVDIADLTPPERFCFEMARHPRLRSMLHALKQRHQLPQGLGRAKSALATVAEAARQLMDSTALRALFGSLLAHGNYLNAGTARAGARGVKLDALDKARSVKSADGKLTLLEHACAATCLARAQLLTELGGVRSACKVPLLDVIRIIQELEEGVDVVGQEIALCPLPGLDEDVAADATGGAGGPGAEEHRVAVRFRSAMAPFHSDMRRGLDELTAHRDETRALLKRLAGWLGEDPNQANPDAILKVCADFIDTAIGCGTVPEESDE